MRRLLVKMRLKTMLPRFSVETQRVNAVILRYPGLAFEILRQYLRMT
jgi:hypothetical protein